MQNVGGDIRSRPSARGPANTPRAGAPYRSNNGDDDDGKLGWSIFHYVFSCLMLLILIFLLVVGIIFLVRVVPPKALSDTCDDLNDCTHDFLETVRGVDSGCCSHCNVINDAACTNACHTDPKCQDGACVGTCKGHCANSNALDCPKINAANLTALFDLGGLGNSDYADYFSLRRECALSTCIYTIDILISNVTYARDAFVVARERVWYGNNTNASATNETTHANTFTGWDDFHSNAICLPLIAAADRECMRVIDMFFDLAAAPELDATCTYAYACADPPSYSGSIEFPAKKS